MGGASYWRAIDRHPFPPYLSYVAVNEAKDDSRDVRMRGFAARATVAETLDWVDDHMILQPAEEIELASAAGRVLAQAILSKVDVPAFPRAMMDGYAVQASDTHGATNYNPLRLRCRGEVLPGETCPITIQSGECLRIMTGAAMPSGADAVLPAELARPDDASTDNRSADSSAQTTVLCMGDVAPGKHVGEPGEDVRQGEIVAAVGRRLRPQDLGVLSSIGAAQVPVRRSPRVRIIVTGNELLPPGTTPSGVRIADANSPMLAALIRRDGGLPLQDGITPDDAPSIAEAMQRDDADVVLVSGGSSVGQEDHAPNLLAQLGRLAIHGVAIRPSSPAGVGQIDNRLVFLLPGNPVSCLCAYDMFAGRAIRAMSGLPRQWPYARQRLPLARKLVSQIGRVDYARVTVVDGKVEPLAISGASVLSSTTRANGFVLVDADSEGFPPDALVDVWRYDAAFDETGFDETAVDERGPNETGSSAAGGTP